MTDPALPIATTFLAGQEGFRSHPYADEGGVWTQGFGFTYLPTGAKVTADTPPITQEDAYAFLENMAGRVLANVRVMVAAEITNNQAAALCSFAFNEGTHALRGSTLLACLNKGDVTGAASQFGAWIYAAGHASKGLEARRAAERALFLTPDVNEPPASLNAPTAVSTVVASDPDNSADVLMAKEMGE